MSAATSDAGGPQDYIHVRHKGLLTLAAITAMIMQILDGTIANVALPHIQASLGATQESISWVLTSYIIASVVTLPVLGWVGGRFGVRNAFIGSIILFTGASAACGLAQNIGQLVLFRLLQGVGGAFISPLAQTIMLDTNPPEKRARAMVFFSQGVMLGPIAGPVIGGYLTESFDWRWVFYVNVPIGILVTFILLATMPSFPKRDRRFDLFGWLLIAVALGSLQLLLDRGQSKDWFQSTEILIWAAMAVTGSWMFVVHMATSKEGLFPRAVFRDRNLLLSIGLFFIIGLVMLSIMALLPALMQSIYGYPSIDAGWLLTPRGIGILITMTIVGRIHERVDQRALIGLGLLITAFSLHMMSGWGPDIPRETIIVTGFVQGIGLGCTFLPINMLAFATLPQRLRTDGASIVNLSRNLGASFGIAITSVLLARSIQVNHAELSANLALSDLPIDLDSLRRYGESGEMGYSVLDALVNRQAVMIGYINDFYAMSIACLCAVPLVFLLRKPSRSPSATGTSGTPASAAR